MPLSVDEEPIGALVPYEQDEAVRPWESYPEAIMEHSIALTNVILHKICRDLHALAKWMKGWDEMIRSGDWARIRDRGRDGQCRESNKTKVCEAWDPTVLNSNPKFINEERRVAAVFYGGIMDWASQKGQGLEFWTSTSSDGPTMVLRAI